MSEKKQKGWMLPEWTDFIQIGKAFFFISPTGSRHKLIKLTQVANGDKKLCIIREVLPDGKVDAQIKFKDQVKDEEYYDPKGDLLWINIDPPLEGHPTIVLDLGYDPIGLTHKFLRTIYRTFKHPAPPKGFIEAKGEVIK